MWHLRPLSVDSLNGGLTDALKKPPIGKKCNLMLAMRLQTTDRQKAIHMSPPCKLHRWAQKLARILKFHIFACNLFAHLEKFWTWNRAFILRGLNRFFIYFEKLGKPCSIRLQSINQIRITEVFKNQECPVLSTLIMAAPLLKLIHHCKRSFWVQQVIVTCNVRVEDQIFKGYPGDH